MSKKTLIWIVVIILVVIGIWLMNKNQGSDSSLIDQNGPVVSSSVTPTVTVKKAVPKATELKLSYSETVAQFKDRRIQFNSQCQGIPGQLSVKNNEKIMLDNRSSDSKTLTIDGQKYEIAGYDWKVITASTPKAMPYGMSIHCKSVNNSVGNAGLIYLQANILDTL